MSFIRSEEKIIQHILFGEGGYLAPKQDEMIIVGTARDEAGFDTRTTYDGRERLSRTAGKLVPALARYPIQRVWAGLLPVTPYTHPILDIVP